MTTLAHRTDRQLGELLVDRRLLNRDALEEHLQVAERDGTSLIQLVLEAGDVRDIDLLRTVSIHLGVEFWDPIDGKAAPPTREAVTSLEPAAAHRHQALPLRIDDRGHLVVAVTDPLNDEKREAVGAAASLPVILAMAPREALSDAILVAYEGLGAEEASAPTRATAADDSEFHVNELLDELMDRGGSDLHLAVGTFPQIRLNGVLVPLERHGTLTPARLRNLIYAVLTAKQREQLEEARELDCSHPLPGKGRFRVNVFFQRDSIGAVMRAIPNEIVPLRQLNMPGVVSEFAALKRGLVLVTGPTGAGKSTTLASILDLINSTRAEHIMTIEDPIEFMHRHKMSIVNQREVGADTDSFNSALHHVLRQDPDVILVGEMRDLETISMGLTAAETGHLVFATLHTQNAPQSVERIIDVFPPGQQQQVRVQLSGSIQAIVSQQLVPTKGGDGRVAAVEIMVGVPAIANLIREGKVHQIRSLMQAGGRYGMVTMDASLAQLVRTGRVAYGVARERAQDPEGFETLLSGDRR
ncbi:MAG: PilT/PilU family type 4a pilus ATPase [Acidimicrobiia bacterium]